MKHCAGCNVISRGDEFGLYGAYHSHDCYLKNHPEEEKAHWLEVRRTLWTFFPAFILGMWVGHSFF